MLIGFTAEIGEKQRLLNDWFRTEFGVEKPGLKLSRPEELSSDAFVGEVRKRRPTKQKMSVAELGALRQEYDSSVGAIRELRGRASEYEIELSRLVFRAFGLGAEEEELVWKTAPPRMPRTR